VTMPIKPPSDKTPSRQNSEPARLENNVHQVQFDVWRVLLMEMAHLVTSLLDKPGKGKANLPLETVIDELLRNLNELSEMPGHTGIVTIEHRSVELGHGRGAKNDYRILYGPLVLDNHSAAGVIRRLGVRMSHLAGGLGRAFGILADCGIKKFSISLPAGGHDGPASLKTALLITSLFFRGGWQEDCLRFHADGNTFEVPVIQYPSGAPNLELTLLAAVNSLPPDQMQELVAKHSGKITDSAGIYAAIVDNTSLKHPPIELVWQKRGRKNIFTTDGREQEKSASVLAGRLQLMSGMLNAAENRPDNDKILPVVLEKIRQELERLDADDLDSIHIQKQGICIRRAEQSMIVGLVNSHILDLLELVKEGVDTRRKISAIEAHGFRFSHPDCGDLARNFQMNEEDVRKILDLLGSCYDSNGRFLRENFENRIDDFIKYEKRIFEFLWGFLKQTENRVDRLGFLHALQKVITRLNRPKRFLRFLLSDMCSNPDKVEYADRNALMLANALLRTYNQELDIDIELTPEEVLLVRKGIDEDVVKYAKWRIESDPKKIMTKINTIHDSIEKQLLEGRQPEMLPLRFLLALEREFLIFFALVSGEAANRVLTKMAECYADPSHPIYRSGQGVKYLPELLQQLKIAVRGLGRIGSKTDVEKLNMLLKKAAAFADMPNVTNNTDIENVLEWIRRSITDIERRQATG